MTPAPVGQRARLLLGWLGIVAESLQRDPSNQFTTSHLFAFSPGVAAGSNFSVQKRFSMDDRQDKNGVLVSSVVPRLRKSSRRPAIPGIALAQRGVSNSAGIGCYGNRLLPCRGAGRPEPQGSAADGCRPRIVRTSVCE